MGTGLRTDHVERGDCGINLFWEETVEEYDLKDLRLGDFVAIMATDHNYGRVYRRSAVSVGVVTHYNSVTAGPRYGFMTMFTSKSGAIKPFIDDNAKIAHILKLRDDIITC